MAVIANGAILLRQDLPAVPQSVPLARRATRAALANARACDEDTAQVVLLLVSELVTNAVLALTSGAPQGPRDQQTATGPPVMTLAVGRVDGAVRIEVADPVLVSPPIPAPDPAADGLDENGRGLYLVATQSRSWGWEVRNRKKIMWCEVAVPPR